MIRIQMPITINPFRSCYESPASDPNPETPTQARVDPVVDHNSDTRIPLSGLADDSEGTLLEAASLEGALDVGYRIVGMSGYRSWPPWGTGKGGG